MYFYEKENYIEAKKLLKDEYAICFKKAETYIHAINNGIVHEENCMMQILDDFLSAQKEEKALNKITGSNLRKFCDTIMNAETERLFSRKIIIIEWITVIPLSLMFLVLVQSFVFCKEAFTLENMNNLRITGSNIIFVSLVVIAYIIKIIISKLFFNKIKMMKISYAVIVVCLIVLASFNLDRLNMKTTAYIPISFPTFLSILILSIAVYVLCIIISTRNRVKYMPSQDVEEDVEQEICPAQVICPSCGKEHDYDYPRCPYCKHKYVM